MRLTRTVNLLHESGAVHRDITPRNVFITGKRELKLGDFGIAVHRVGKHDVLADAFALWFAPKGLSGTGKKKWRPADDVFHLGQLYAVLLCGYAGKKLTARDVKDLCCSPETKIVIQRCIGERRKRFTNASKLLAALETQECPKQDNEVIRSLSGKRVVFTGTLSVVRHDAERLVREAGGFVQRRVNHRTNVIVIGHNSPQWLVDARSLALLGDANN